MCSRETFIVIHIIEQEDSEKYADQKYISKLYKYHVLISNFILSRSAGAPSGEARKPPFGKSLIAGEGGLTASSQASTRVDSL